MTGTDDALAVNARRVSEVAYGPDPRGWRTFRRLSGVLQAGHTGRAGTRVIDPVSTFGGALDVAPQGFSGMAPLGAAAPVAPASSTLGDQRAAGALTNGALSIFAERLRRGK